MQIICGQCRTQLTVELHPDMTCVQCTNCGHEITLGDSQDENISNDDFFVGGDAPSEGFANQAQRVLRERILITCSKCGGKMRIPRRMMGRKIRCKSCSKMLQIPNIEDDGEFFNGENRAANEGNLSAAMNDDVENDEDYATSMKRKTSARESALPKLIVVVAVVLIITGFVLSWIFLSRPGPQETSGDEDLPVAAVGAIPVTDRQGEGVPAVSSKAIVTCISGEWSIFVAGGYFPAPLGRMYCMLTVRIEVGPNPVGFDNFGPAVILSIGKDNYESLGERPDDPAGKPPILSRKGAVRLGSGDSRKVTFVFDIPAEKATGTLLIEGMNEVTVSLPAPGKLSRDVSIVGNYHEVVPRNIKPLLQDPVMEAIQDTINQKLIVSRAGDGGLRLVIPRSGVSGKVYPDGNGVFDVVLQKGRDFLRARLRLVDDGNLVILYLRNSPMYQITYSRDGVTSSFVPLHGAADFFDESSAP